MKNIAISGKFEETAAYQQRYEALLSVCDKLGTMVSQNRRIEKDADIAPYRFFREGTREYVFPKQEVTLALDDSRTIDPSPSYGLWSEKQTFNLNAELVKGRLRIEYNDANNAPHLSIFDVLGNSVLPKKVQKALEALV